MDLFKSPAEINTLLSEYHFTTTRNFYTSLITILQTEEKQDKKVIQQYISLVKKGNEVYVKENETGFISVKQSENFVGIEKLDELIKKLKDYKDGIEDLSHKIGRNFMVVGSKKIFISRNGYKTNKKYGQIIFDIVDKPLIKEIRRYIKTLSTNEMFPFPDKGSSDKKQQLANYLNYNSMKHIGVKLSTTIIAKITNSHDHLDKKEELEKDSKERGHAVSTLLNVYVKKPLPTAEEEPTQEDTVST